MSLEIQNAEDWHKVSTKIQKLVSALPEFHYDYRRLIKNIEIKIKELCLIDLQLRRQDSLYYQQQRKDKLREINEVLRTFSKLHLMATLSKR